MKLKEFMKFLIHTKDKNSNYIERFMIATTAELSTLEEVDNLSNEDYIKYLKQSHLDFSISDQVQFSFIFNDKTYNVLDENTLLTEHFIALENTISLADDQIVKAYPGILAIATNTNEHTQFFDLDHKIAIPIISFFLNLFQQLDNNILQSMKVLIQDQIPQEVVHLKTTLIDNIHLYINYLFLQQMMIYKISNI